MGERYASATDIPPTPGSPPSAQSNDVLTPVFPYDDQIADSDFEEEEPEPWPEHSVPSGFVPENAKDFTQYVRGLVLQLSAINQQSLHPSSAGPHSTQGVTSAASQPHAWSNYRHTDNFPAGFPSHSQDHARQPFDPYTGQPSQGHYPADMMLDYRVSFSHDRPAFGRQADYTATPYGQQDPRVYASHTRTGHAGPFAASSAAGYPNPAAAFRPHNAPTHGDGAQGFRGRGGPPHAQYRAYGTAQQPGAFNRFPRPGWGS